MANVIAPENLGAAIAQELTVYSKEVNAKLDRVGSKAIKDLERRTKDTAPFNAQAYHRHYVDCIATKKETSRTGASKFIWYVKPPGHRLTHLLVKGHATKDGGRTRSDPFLQNALSHVLPEYENAVMEALKK